MSESIKTEESLFGKLTDKKAELKHVKKFTLTNKNGFSVSLISYGAAIQSISLKDKSKKLTNVVLGFESLEEYTDSTLNPYFGATIGRVTNRISNAEFKLNDKVHKLVKNNGDSCLHGGPDGLSQVFKKKICIKNFEIIFFKIIKRKIFHRL